MAEPGLSEPPTRLCCGQPHWGAVCPDGRVMCTICFDRFDQDQLMCDAAGITWDVCKGCEDQVGD